MTQEIWKPIKGYEDLYEVSNLGNVKSVSRIVKGVRYGKYYEFTIKERILKQTIDNKGYYRVKLYKDGISETKKVHRIVAESFFGDIYNKEIDHINTIKNDNRIENLRIVTSKENANNPLTKEHYAVGNKYNNVKPIRCIFKDGTIKEFESLTDAVNKGYATHIGSVSKCCNGKKKTHNKCRWEFI